MTRAKKVATAAVTIDPSPQLTAVVDAVVRIATIKESDAVKIAALSAVVDLSKDVKLEVRIEDCYFEGHETGVHVRGAK